jgi:prepilin-type N-terminal cleavage/methylation domain-containing protein
MRCRQQRGLTLIELVIALSLVGALLVIMFSGLRVGLTAWSRGEGRAEMLEHERNIEQLVARTLSGSFPYRDRAGTGSEDKTGLLFQGVSERLAFVTAAPPVPSSSVPIAFTAVTFSLESGVRPGLAIRQKALPNLDPFEPVEPIFVDPAVTALRFRYRREVGNPWEERWDATKETALPLAVEVTLTTLFGGRRIDHPPLIIPIRVVPS